MLLSIVKSRETSLLIKASVGCFIIPEISRPNLKSIQHPREMTPQGNTHFRCRFSLVLFLVSLLASPTQSSSAEKSCNAVSLAWAGVEVKFPLGKNPQFVRNLTDCFNGVKKIGNEIQVIIKQLPELIDKVLPVAKKEGLVLLSVYLLYKSFVLYD